jgi:hypothetical protein
MQKGAPIGAPFVHRDAPLRKERALVTS